MQITRFLFPKKYRLSSKSEIEILFNHNKSFLVFPFKVVWAINNHQDSSLKLLISVPKNKINKAVRRNCIKRLTREAFRKNKNLLIEALEINNQKISIALIYVHNDIVNYKVIENSISTILTKKSIFKTKTSI